jgi:adenylate cyclase
MGDNTHYILAVDDEKDVPMLYQTHFRQEIKAGKYTFFFASDGEEALKILRKHPKIGVILLDIEMPKMNGLTFIAKLKQQEYREIYEDYGRFYKAIMVTAYDGNAEYRSQYMQNGAFDVIGKPVNFKNLEIIMNKAITELDILYGIKRKWHEERDRRLNAERRLADIQTVLSGSLNNLGENLYGSNY